MAKHNWQTTERVCLACGAVQRRDTHPCPYCGGRSDWSATDLLVVTTQFILRAIGYAIAVPVVVFLLGTLSPVQIVVEHAPTTMRADGACFVPMPAEAILVRIAPQCPAEHIAMRYPSETRGVVLAFDAIRREPWARDIDALYLTIFDLIDMLIRWIATGATSSNPG